MSRKAEFAITRFRALRARARRANALRDEKATSSATQRWRLAPWLIKIATQVSSSGGSTPPSDPNRSAISSAPPGRRLPSDNGRRSGLLVLPFEQLVEGVEESSCDHPYREELNVIMSSASGTVCVLKAFIELCCRHGPYRRQSLRMQYATCASPSRS